MTRSRRSLLVALAIVSMLAAPAVAQQPTPHIGYVYPAGGRQGASLEVVLGGQFLDGVARAIVSGAGVEATVAEYTKPITPGQANKLKERLAELQKKDRTAEVLKEIAEIRKKLATFVRRPPNPAIAETVTLNVRISPDAEPGQRELRLRTSAGLTNPLAFCIGQLPEVSEKPAKGLPPMGEGKKAKYRKFFEPSSPAGPVEITLPATLNGQILPGEVDRYRFHATKGLRLVAVVSARDLIPYLADAVPGWFQAALTLYDARGNELAYVDDYRFHPDPVLLFEIPAEGEYILEIRDAIYRGREDFVYRIAVGELPFVTGVFPLGGRAGTKTEIELVGWNLPESSLIFDARRKQPGVYALAVRREGLLSNVVSFQVDALPESLEQEPNSQRAAAQEVPFPIIVNGRIDEPGDWDLFRFEGRAGQEIVAEVRARRLGSPLDSILRLTDANGKQVAINDDHEDKGVGLLTHHADSWLRAKLPAAGTYFLHLGDTQDHGGPEYAYRLRISSPRPDFELRVVPSSVNARPGATLPITVHAVRRDGFSDEIALELKDAPRGFALSGNRIPAGEDQVRLTLSVPPSGSQEPLPLHVEGRATIGGRVVARMAVPADDLMQAFAYRHLVPASDLEVSVEGRSFLRSPIRILSPTPIKIPAGGTARIRIGLPAASFERLQFELSDPPEGISVKQVVSSSLGTEIVVQSDPTKVKPGLKGNLIVAAYAKSVGGKTKKPQAAVRRPAPLTTLPAVPFEVVGR
jgi:hypothetical protein